MRLLLAKYICVCKIYTCFFLNYEILFEKLTTRMPDGADKYFCDLDSNHLGPQSLPSFKV